MRGRKRSNKHVRNAWITFTFETDEIMYSHALHVKNGPCKSTTLLLSRRNATDFSGTLEGLIVRLPGEIVRISGRAQRRLLLHSFIPPCKNNEARQSGIRR